MSLVPYSLRPKVLFRELVIKYGVSNPNPLVRPVAMLLIGAQSEVLRARAIRRGLILGNPFWRLIGGMILVQELNRRVLQKQPERLGRERLGAGRFVTVAVTAPRLDLTRRERRAELRRLRADAVQRVASFKQRS